jgi:ankyrin repeat protein
MSLQDLTRNVHNLEQLQMLHAVYQDDIDQMSELLQSGSDPNLVGSEGSPLLHVAVESGSDSVVFWNCSDSVVFWNCSDSVVF